MGANYIFSLTPTFPPEPMLCSGGGVIDGGRRVTALILSMAVYEGILEAIPVLLLFPVELSERVQRGPVNVTCALCSVLKDTEPRVKRGFTPTSRPMAPTVYSYRTGPPCGNLSSLKSCTSTKALFPSPQHGNIVVGTRITVLRPHDSWALC